ncbi:MAG: N-acetyltransferase [Candidatus Latescibacteria bacterium]|nr:N-acetyltransferase [Candidatus Latescibacterota bacterium]
MSIHLRGERIGDEDAIDVVNCSAFGSMEEANIVRNMRTYYPAYDRRYSVTAWEDDDIVGHVLFSPARIRLMGETLSALAVGPVAVIPKRQRQGIGGRLLRYGHELGKREGFACAFLQGHPSYYPRHGYRPCYGFAKTTIDTDKLPEPSRKFLRLPVRGADIPWLVERWEIEWRDVDFGWLWGTAPGEWAIPGIDTKMWWTEDGHRAAYTIGDKLIIAENPAWAREVIAFLKPKQLDHHPSGWLTRHVLDAEWAAAEVNRSDAAMVYEFRKGMLEEYLKALESGERLPGVTAFPLPFKVC